MSKRIEERIEDIRDMVKAFYEKPDNAAGGVLHITTDDYNIEDHHIEFCLHEAHIANDKDAIDICHALLDIPVGPDRYRAIGLDAERAEAIWLEDTEDGPE